jgi:hypothetical protein
VIRPPKLVVKSPPAPLREWNQDYVDHPHSSVADIKTINNAPKKPQVFMMFTCVFGLGCFKGEFSPFATHSLNINARNRYK